MVCEAAAAGWFGISLCHPGGPGSIPRQRYLLETLLTMLQLTKLY